MYQIDVATAAAVRPAATSAGTAGWFTDGNPGTATPATVVPGEFLNSVMAELLAVISAGGVTPSKANSDDLLSAIRALIAYGGSPTGEVTAYFGASAPTGWLLANGSTIGDATSSATGRANADTATLYALIWGNTDNSTDGGAYHIQDSTGTPTTRGVSAAADFAAHKRLPLPDMRGLFVRGLNSSGSGYDASRVLGTYQADLVGPHTHSLKDNSILTGGAGTQAPNNSTGTTLRTATNDGTGSGSETIVKNRALTFIIKL